MVSGIILSGLLTAQDTNVNAGEKFIVPPWWHQFRHSIVYDPISILPFSFTLDLSPHWLINLL